MTDLNIKHVFIDIMFADMLKSLLKTFLNKTLKFQHILNTNVKIKAVREVQ